MAELGILGKVKYTEWAAPIVPVDKPDGSYRICGDYKVTINSVLKTKEHPLSTPQELFMKLNGGQKFTKLDMSNVYQQVVLDEGSRQLVCINTNLGLYRYIRHPFDVSSATAIFQENMEKILVGLEGAVCYVGDIIVTRRTGDEHKENLYKMLQRLADWGIRLRK
ncbi:hypothetical protein HOLleu_04563 [Holothuria leucospilota]|uniref:Reverse transcriptase domain-containing protein n=1 Tax=Holothuria leucospilota TaxID=206669 RepID=A0A9Q1CUH2_HOLLE|nr:hypothetical protein HOLleu_04563 [Holothuria leucospilota]